MSARSKVWKNKNISWGKLVRKLQEENKTNETYKEYMSANKDERLKIKDVGGYVGGYLRGGRRKPENVVHRQLLTLDVDFAHLDFWDDFTMLYPNAVVIHATHTHSDKTPKYRLIMPLSREVTPDEYGAVSRRIAGDLDIELFDNTGFQSYRLMFWPSNPKDVDYYFQFQDGPWIDVDAVLASYIDWTDSSLWPTSKAYEDDVKNLSKKQEDPEQKRGVIGAFCRTYPITEAISNFLPDIYSPTDNGRYTYVNGSTASGLITYDDKFAYSHHGTDPCSGKLSNSFDLVRIHMFGHLDTGAQTAKPKSHSAMENFAREDKTVRKTLARENLDSAKYDFADDYIEEQKEEKENWDWVENLEINTKGEYLSNANNLNMIFANDDRLKDAFQLNLFDSKRYVLRSLPWRKIPIPEPIKNVDYSGVRNYIESVYGVVGNLKIDDSLALEIEKKSFHPVKDYLSGLDWDQTERLDTLLIDYFGTQDDIYHREAIRKTLVGAVARIYNPGVKFDLVLTLVGNQGTGKSTLAKKLGGPWFSDTFMTVHGKDAFEQLQGAWIIEMAELSGLRKAEVEAVKHFISKQEDTFRPAYGRTSETFKRQCVFIGTTNNKSFLRDPSGNRRFMPIDIDRDSATKDIFKIEEETINQLWAEAVYLYTNGEKLYLSETAEDIAKIEQRAHGDWDERTGIVYNFLNTLLPSNWDQKDVWERRTYLDDDKEQQKGTDERSVVCMAEIWCECLGKEKEDMDRYKTREINDILRNLQGWTQAKSTKKFPIYGKQRYYFKDDL